jgi:uncharacterized repeat protein (TIGR01451 family)
MEEAMASTGTVGFILRPDSVLSKIGTTASNTVDSGAAYVYARSGSTWDLQAVLNGSSGGRFGTSVAVDGDWLVIGAPEDDTDSGTAAVYFRVGSTWSLADTLTADDREEGDEFGTSVGLDGTTAVVGARYDDHAGGSNAGSAYVFVYSGTNWGQQVKLVAVDGAADDHFGCSVAVSGDSVAVGAIADDTTVTDTGSAYVFVRSGASWRQDAKLGADDAAFSDLFGGSVSIDGDTAVVGAPQSDGGGEFNVGSAHVFQRVGASWSEQQKLTAPSPVDQGKFGTSVSLEGDSIAVGMPYGNGTSGGAAFLYLRSGAVWSRQSTVGPADPEPGDDFGTSVAIQEGWLVVGSPEDNAGEIEGMGSASIFRPAQADVQITKDDGQAAAIPGQSLTYTVIASNPAGPDSINATVSDAFPSGLSGCSWTCVSTGGASCTVSGVGDIADSVNLPVGGVVTFTATCMVDQSATGTVTNTATVEAPMVEDSNPANNTATDIDHVTALADWIFSDGFESGNANVWSGVVPPLKLRPMVLDQPVERVSAIFRLTGPGLSSRASGPIFAGLNREGKPLFVLLMRHRGRQVLLALNVLRADGSLLVTEWMETVSAKGQFDLT